jgi:pimeloyl-ACP methyl ester carboxylesterase
MPLQARGVAIATALVLFALVSTGAATPSEDGAAHRSVTLPDGAVVALTMTGSGPPLVFIHGRSCNREHWRAQIPVFASSRGGNP